MHGKTHWYIPDAYLPSSGLGEFWEGHESVCVLNAGTVDATLTFTFFFANRDPIENVTVVVPARRDRHLGLHKPEDFDGLLLPRDVPYGIGIESDQPVIVQYSRLDVTQPNFTLMTTIPFSV